MNTALTLLEKVAPSPEYNRMRQKIQDVYATDESIFFGQLEMLHEGNDVALGIVSRLNRYYEELFPVPMVEIYDVRDRLAQLVDSGIEIPSQVVQVLKNEFGTTNGKVDFNIMDASDDTLLMIKELI